MPILREAIVKVPYPAAVANAAHIWRASVHASFSVVYPGAEAFSCTKRFAVMAG